MGTTGGSGTRGGGGGVNGGGAETAAVPTHLCAHLTGQTSPWVEHRPSPKNGHSTGVPLAACRHPQVLWVYSSGGLGAGDGAEGQPGLGPVPGGREAPEEVPAGRSDCSGPAPAMGGGISLSGTALELKVVKPQHFDSVPQIADHLLIEIRFTHQKAIGLQNL